MRAPILRTSLSFVALTALLALPGQASAEHPIAAPPVRSVPHLRLVGGTDVTANAKGVHFGATGVEHKRGAVSVNENNEARTSDAAPRRVNDLDAPPGSPPALLRRHLDELGVRARTAFASYDRPTFQAAVKAEWNTAGQLDAVSTRVSRLKKALGGATAREKLLASANDEAALFSGSIKNLSRARKTLIERIAHQESVLTRAIEEQHRINGSEVSVRDAQVQVTKLRSDLEGIDRSLSENQRQLTFAHERASKLEALAAAE